MATIARFNPLLSMTSSDFDEGITLPVKEENALTRLSAATTALAEARTLDDVKRIVDIAEAARTYARAAKLGLEAANYASEIKLRAERKAGEMLAQLERGQGGDRRSDDFQISQPAKFESSYKQVLDDNDVTYQTAHRWQTVATVPDEVFEQHLAEVKADGDELSTARLLRVAQEIKREQMRQDKKDAPELPNDKYRVLYADPPWQYNNAGVITDTDAYGRAARHYPTMSIAELCALGSKVKEMAEPDAVLFMWVTSPLLEECFDVIRAWGFQYKTSFVWDKVGHNYGHYNSVRHELLLVCTRGSCTPDDKTLYDSVISIEKSRTHSEKPAEFRRMIDSLYTWGNRIELFARAQVDGWEAWGNE